MSHKRSYCRGSKGRSVKLYLEKKHEEAMKEMKVSNGYASNSQVVREIFDEYFNKSKKKKR